MRTIELHLTFDDVKQLAQGTAPGALDRAFTRFLTWGLDGYTHVKIFREHRGVDLVAAYSSESSHFVLGAVYGKDTGTYSFHS
jgi:hypothetical protein